MAARRSKAAGLGRSWWAGTAMMNPNRLWGRRGSVPANKVDRIRRSWTTLPQQIMSVMTKSPCEELSVVFVRERCGQPSERRDEQCNTMSQSLGEVAQLQPQDRSM